MKTCILLVAMIAPSFVDDDPRPTEADLRLGHSLISGVWEYSSYVDNGENVGLRLIRERYAEDGRITIGNRVIQVNSPDSSEANIRGYRINPVASPKQIDLTNTNDQVQPGIYRFDDDELVLCYQKQEGAGRPKDFTSSAGSNRVLIHLRLVQGESDKGPKSKLDATPVIQTKPASTGHDAAPAPAQAPASMDLDIKRAHQLLMGIWRLDSMVDNGDRIGRIMIEQKVARGGKVTISHRVVEMVNPENGQTKISTYRIDPTATPRQINVTNPSGQVLRGIYQFEGDSLVVCVHHRDDGARPVSFDSSPGSFNVLLMLKMTDREPPSAPKREEEPRPGRIDLTSSSSSREFAIDGGAPVALASRTTTTTTPRTIDVEPARKATEADLNRAHALLSGVWKYESVVEDGQTLSADLIRRKLARDGKMIIGNRVMEVISPSTGEKRISAYRINPTTNPRQIDVINQFDTVLRGIYKFEGDELWLCLHDDGDGERPSEFEAPAGSSNRLIRLRMAPPEPKVAKPAPPPQPTPEEKEREREAKIRSMMVGSWTYSDREGSTNFVFQPEGTFVATRYWSKAFKRLFEGDATTSSGTWSYNNGRVRIVVNSTNDRSKLGQVSSFRLEEIGESKMIAADVMGVVRGYRRMR